MKLQFRLIRLSYRWPNSPELFTNWYAVLEPTPLRVKIFNHKHAQLLEYCSHLRGGNARVGGRFFLSRGLPKKYFAMFLCLRIEKLPSIPFTFDVACRTVVPKYQLYLIYFRREASRFFFALEGHVRIKYRVIVEKADSSSIPNAENRLHIRADSHLADLFVEIWNKIFKVERRSKTYSLFVILKHEDLVCEFPSYINV
ncbi:uncharacterized protein LOC141711668 isoform X1 [Apium graveolens]|uniref:uncharacterized protein LOC141711668 isoform X1 n=1 Tax=Apium graveolens TaxID=4045 RepID=UPI003D790FC3